MQNLHGWEIKIITCDCPYAVVSRKDGAKFEINQEGIDIVDIGNGSSFLQHDVIKHALEQLSQTRRKK